MLVIIGIKIPISEIRIPVSSIHIIPFPGIQIIKPEGLGYTRKESSSKEEFNPSYNES